MKVTLTRVGGYDPALGRVVDPTLETTMPRGKKKKKAGKSAKRQTVTPANVEPQAAPLTEWEYMTRMTRYAELPVETAIATSTWEAFSVVPRDGETCMIFFRRQLPMAPAQDPALDPPANGVEDNL